MSDYFETTEDLSKYIIKTSLTINDIKDIPSSLLKGISKKEYDNLELMDNIYIPQILHPIKNEVLQINKHKLQNLINDGFIDGEILFEYHLIYRNQENAKKRYDKMMQIG